jgi:hypothetical protein
MRRTSSCGVIILMAALVPAAQQAPNPGVATGARQPGPAQPVTPPQNRTDTPATGTARIRGRVVADTGAPVREAEVRLSGDLVRQTETDDTGRFEFADLPAGRFLLNATKTGFARPMTLNAVGTITSITQNPSFELVDGQVLNRAIVLPRGGVITGRLVDEFGEPVTGAEMRVERYVYGPGGRQLAQHATSGPASWITNDRGEYRVFGLAPGDYIVSARTRQLGVPVTIVTGGARDRAEGLLPTYFPGTVRVAEAQTVRVGAAQEVAVNFAAVSGRLVRVSGTVSSSTGRTASGLNVFLGVETSNSSGQINGGGIAADGSFSIGNVPPGDYVLRVRAQGGGSRGSEVASMPISVSTQDLAGLHLITRPGATIRGRVEWDGSSPRPTAPMRISTRSADWSPGPLAGETTITYLDLENGTVREDGTFELGGIVGKILFNANARSWFLKSVTVDGRDVTSTGIDAATLDGDQRVLIEMTDKAATLSGTARDARRQPVSDYVVVLLPEQAIAGMGATRFTRLLRADENGTFRVSALPPGNYVAAALEALDSGREWDPAIQKAVRSAGHPFTLTDGQTAVLNLELLR